MAIDIAKNEIAYSEALMRLFELDFDDIRSVHPGDAYRQLVLQKILDCDRRNCSGKYGELLFGIKIYNDITVSAINYFKGINFDGGKFPAGLKDMNERMMEESIRTVEENVKSMRTYIVYLN